MKTTPCREAVEPLEVELLVSDHTRRCLLTDAAGRDEIDQDTDPLAIQRPPQRRSAKETKRLLSILDEIAGKECVG